MLGENVGNAPFLAFLQTCPTIFEAWTAETDEDEELAEKATTAPSAAEVISFGNGTAPGGFESKRAGFELQDLRRYRTTSLAHWSVNLRWGSVREYSYIRRLVRSASCTIASGAAIAASALEKESSIAFRPKIRSVFPDVEPTDGGTSTACESVTCSTSSLLRADFGFVYHIVHKNGVFI